MLKLNLIPTAKSAGSSKRQRAKKREIKDIPKSQHTHICHHCGFIWHCLEGVKCKVAVAAKVNKQGPWCEFCRSLIMVEHVIAIRQWWHLQPIIEALYHAIDCHPHLLTKTYVDSKLAASTGASMSTPQKQEKTIKEPPPPTEKEYEDPPEDEEDEPEDDDDTDDEPQDQ